MAKYDNSGRLDEVGEKDWREALDGLTAYLRWRLRGKTRWGAHSERVLETPALDYYTEEAVAKLIEGDWKWQERYSLGQQLVEIAGNLITKQAEKYKREHPRVSENADDNCFVRRMPELIELRESERLPDCIDPSTGSGTEQEGMDETYEQVMRLVNDDAELTAYVEAVRACGHFSELPEYLGLPVKRVYRLQEKLMRRIRRFKVSGFRFQVSGSRFKVSEEASDECKKGMNFIDKIYRFEAERCSAEENYAAFGTSREVHQERMLDFISREMEEAKELLKK